MEHQKMLDFVLRMTKHALDKVQHFDGGGTVLGAPGTAGTQNAVNPDNQGIAGFAGNILGTNNHFQATGAPIQNGTNVNQLNNSYAGAQGSLSQANDLVGTLNPGIAQGAQTQGNLTNQLTAEANGQGPNPAQAALNQSTGQNIANQAALMASQRGAGANPGQIARQAAMQGSAIQQQAVGQSATLQAQQQLAAQNALQGLASNQIQQGTGAIQLGNQTQQNEQNILQGANTANNNENVSMQGNINSTNAAVAGGNQNANQNVIQGIGNAASSLGGLAGLFAQGGKVPMPDHLNSMAKIFHPHMAEGGEVWQNSTPVSSPISMGPAAVLPAYTGTFGQKMGGGGGGKNTGTTPQGTAPTGVGGTYGLGGQDMSDQLGQAGSGFGAAPLTSDSLVMPELGGGIGSAASQAPSLMATGLAYGGKAPDVGSKMKSGGKVPGKPKVDKDSYSNDTVDAKLSPGEVVIDLNTLNDKGKLGQMARFVANNIERKKAGRKLS